jgi:eukaryotic-like serine/threonine-protein kinase
MLSQPRWNRRPRDFPFLLHNFADLADKRGDRPVSSCPRPGAFSVALVMHPFSNVPGYDLLHPLGGGPLTVVFSARRLEDDSPCAVKLLRSDWEDQAAGIKLLQREARAVLAVEHPHIVRVLETHVTRPPYFLVMEWLAGESLRTRLKRDYCLDLSHALWIARQTAEALASLHRAGFLHGDVKPDNIQLVTEGQAVLLDLGFAHRPGENAAFLRSGYVLGTANYLAPELCGADPTAGFASDIFSLGATLFEVLTGQLPYPPGSIDQIFRRHSSDPPADIRIHLPMLPPALGRLIERMLARRPEQRPKAIQVVRQLIGLEIARMARRRSA